jgi:hypothetical protein
MEVHQKAKNRLIVWPYHTTLGHRSKVVKINTQEAYTPIFIEALFTTAKLWN